MSDRRPMLFRDFYPGDCRQQIGEFLATYRPPEGIETQAICELVAQWGCDEGQGYYIARPMAPELLLGWAAQNALTAQSSAG